MPSLAENHQYLGFIPSLVGVGGGSLLLSLPNMTSLT